MHNLDPDRILLQSHIDQLNTQSREMLESLDDNGRGHLYDRICGLQERSKMLPHAIGLLAHTAFIATTLHVAKLTEDEDEQEQQPSPLDLASAEFTAEKTMAYLQERQPDSDVPHDVTSHEFAQWLTDRMRHAFCKGMLAERFGSDE